MMTGTVKQPQTAPPGPAWPTGTRPRGAAVKAQLLLSPEGAWHHTRHHELPKCPQMEDFGPLPAGPSQRIPFLLEGGISATNSPEIPLCAPRPPEISSQIPSPRTPRTFPGPAAAPRIFVLHLGGRGGDFCPHLCHLCPHGQPRPRG